VVQCQGFLFKEHAMGVHYDAYLVVGWNIEIPETEDGEDMDVDDYLSPLCRKIKGSKLGYITAGDAYFGRENHYITMPSESVAEVQSSIATHETIAKELTDAGAKLGPFLIEAVGYIS